MDLGLKDKVILVSGGGSGVGAGITRACLAEGARVMIAGRVTESVTRFMQEMTAAHQPCELIPAELGSAAACRSIVDKTLERYGRLDGLAGGVL